MQSDASRRVAGAVVGPSRSERFRAAERRILAISRILDTAFRVPGTGFRFGLDPIVGLIPWVGDVLSAVVGLWIIGEASRFDVPRIVLARMAWNTLTDLFIGAIPFVGDLLDFVSRSNERNVELFRRHAADPTASTGDQWRFFVGLALIVAGSVWLVARAFGWLISQWWPLA
jgi:hypothetical protein